jgi:CarD family transcriptional regulator
MSIEDESGSSAVALAVKTVAKKASAAAASPAAKTAKPPEPELKTVKKVTSAANPKPDPKPAAKAAPKPAAKPPAKAAPKAAETPLPKPEPKPLPKVAAKPAAEPAPKPVAPPAATAPAPPPQASSPAPAPQSHSGVISGPMRPMTPPRAMAKAEIFVDGDFVVYPTHGVGKVERIATEEIAGHTLELIHITFDENRMTLRVPTNKARTAGLRKLASRKQFDDVLATLKGRARIKRTMWSRRAQEYEAKINSGDPQSIAEVVRDLHRNAGQPDQSFSERQIYESALDRLAAEYGALEQVDKATATERLIAHLKSE